jgi:hypothetical protein
VYKLLKISTEKLMVFIGILPCRVNKSPIEFQT